MKLLPLIALSAALSISQVTLAFADVEFGQPEFHNYLSPPGLRGSCFWWNSAWFWACPYPSPAAIAPALVVKSAPAVVVKTKIKAK